MSVSHADALVAYLACGYPTPSQRMVDLAAAAVALGRVTPMRAHARHRHDFAGHAFAVEITQTALPDALEILHDSGLASMVHATLEIAHQPMSYATAVIGHVLVPVATYEQLRVAGVLHEGRVDKQAKSTARALANGTRVTIAERAHTHRTDR